MATRESQKINQRSVAAHFTARSSGSQAPHDIFSSNNLHDHSLTGHGIVGGSLESLACSSDSLRIHVVHHARSGRCESGRLSGTRRKITHIITALNASGHCNRTGYRALAQDPPLHYYSSPRRERRHCPYAWIDEHGEWDGEDGCNNNDGVGFTDKSALSRHLRNKHQHRRS
ncbi:hypothetical protein N431DRAFT_484965 [Stipitochalara longipes BDJ]|nr:hypothetical protein N431DRAFT_484965 [Stipitochalara longipes BDJ]